MWTLLPTKIDPLILFIQSIKSCFYSIEVGTVEASKDMMSVMSTSYLEFNHSEGYNLPIHLIMLFLSSAIETWSDVLYSLIATSVFLWCFINNLTIFIFFPGIFYLQLHEISMIDTTVFYIQKSGVLIIEVYLLKNLRCHVFDKWVNLGPVARSLLY